MLSPMHDFDKSGRYGRQCRARVAHALRKLSCIILINFTRREESSGGFSDTTHDAAATDTHTFAIGQLCYLDPEFCFL